MSAIRIRIGASLDADLASLVFKPLVAAAKEARAQVRKELEGIGDDLNRVSGRARRGGRGGNASDSAPAGGSPYRTPGGGDEGVRRQKRSNQASEQEATRHEQAIDRIEEQGAQRRKRRVQAVVDEAKRLQEREQIARTALATVGRTSSGLVRRGVGVMGDLAQGAGVNWNMQGLFKDFVSRQKMAVDLSNASYQAGAKGPAGVRQQPHQLMHDANAIGMETAMDPTKILAGMQAFVGKSGDLQGARDALKDLAVLSRATGTNIEDMVNASGDAFANLGDEFKTGADKARAVVDVMRAVAGQGKLGAVEVKDMASQLAKLASLAGSFQGGRVQNMALLGAFAQAARQSGGASSAEEATTSVQALMQTFGKGARLKAFDAKKINVFSDPGKTQVRDIQSILLESLSKTRGSIPEMAKLFASSQAMRSVRGFSTIYGDTYNAARKEKGTTEEKANQRALAAVNAEFARLKGATMGEAEIAESFKASMETAEAKAQKFQNQLQTIADSTATRLLPALEKLGPDAASAAEKLSGLAIWASQNQGVALGGVLAAGVTKAIVDAGIGKVMESAVSKMSGEALGKLGAGGLLITAAAVTLYAMHELNKADDEKKKTARESTEDTLRHANQLQAQLGMERAKEQTAQMAINEEMAKPIEKQDHGRLDKAQAEKQRAVQRQIALKVEADDVMEQLQGDVDNANKVNTLKNDPTRNLGAGSWITSVLQSVGVKTSDRAVNRRDVANAEATDARMGEVKTAIEGLTRLIGGGIVVKNLPGPGAPPLPGGAVGP